MLYTCCNSLRNTCHSCNNTCGYNGYNYPTNTNTNGNGCGCGCGNANSFANGQVNSVVNGVYGIFFPISNRTCCVRRTLTLDCGNGTAWTNTCGNGTANTNGNGCGCGCRRNLCATGTTNANINGDAYYARQYGLYSDSGCGCGFNY